MSSFLMLCKSASDKFEMSSEYRRYNKNWRELCNLNFSGGKKYLNVEMSKNHHHHWQEKLLKEWKNQLMPRRLKPVRVNSVLSLYATSGKGNNCNILGAWGNVLWDNPAQKQTDWHREAHPFLARPLSPPQHAAPKRSRTNANLVDIWFSYLPEEGLRPFLPLETTALPSLSSAV